MKVARIVVPRGDNPPYTLDESEIYIRNEAETTPASCVMKSWNWCVAAWAKMFRRRLNDP